MIVSASHYLAKHDIDNQDKTLVKFCRIALALKLARSLTVVHVGRRTIPLHGSLDQLTTEEATLLTNAASEQYKVALLCFRVTQVKAARVPTVDCQKPACTQKKTDAGKVHQKFGI